MDRIPLKDGRMAEASFIREKDSTREFLGFINALISEKAYVNYERKFTLEQEEQWKKDRIAEQKRKDGYMLVARVDGRLAGSSGAARDSHKGKNNICLGIAIGKGYRRVGLGEGLLKLNIRTAKRFFRPKPKNIYLSVLEPNKPAYSLYTKLGFKEFARFRRWLLHRGRYVDHIFMKL